MADLTYMHRDGDKCDIAMDIPENNCQTLETDADIPELTNVTQVPSRDWQIDCNLNECLLNVYSNERWTDTTIRCGNQDASRTLKAHKIILAARSPVFEAMLFGPCSDGKTEYDFPDADADIFDMMLRFMYNDDANLTSVDDATDLMQMADMYQITRLVDQCAQFLHTNITVDNVCKSLDYALQYNTPTLRDACCDFIDNDAEKVIETGGFLNISNECLTYMLKGDTLFAEEDVIFKRVEEWAKLKLAEAEKEANGQNIRDILGGAFYYLRLPTLSTAKLMKCIKRKGYFSLDEVEDLVECNVQRQSKLSCLYNVRRVPLQESLTASYGTESTKGKNIVQVLTIDIDKDMQLEFIEIPLIGTFMKYNSNMLYKKTPRCLEGRIEGQDLPYGLNPIMSVAVMINKINFENHSNIHQVTDESSRIVFDKPVLLKKRKSPFELEIKIQPNCTDPNVFLVRTYGHVDIKSDSKTCSVSQTIKSATGIDSIGFRNCSFRVVTEEESESLHSESEDLDDSESEKSDEESEKSDSSSTNSDLS